MSREVLVDCYQFLRRKVLLPYNNRRVSCKFSMLV
jgi:hypothetical protein